VFSITDKFRPAFTANINLQPFSISDIFTCIRPIIPPEQAKAVCEVSKKKKVDVLEVRVQILALLTRDGRNVKVNLRF